MNIVYEDESVVVVEKPIGVPTIPERLDAQGACVRKRLEVELGIPLFVVHRLDKEVSGLLIFAKTPEAHRFLNMEFEHRRVEKHYQTLVWGFMEQSSGIIDKPIRQFGSGRMGVDHEQGKPSRTEYQVLERWRDRTLIDARPLTGRRHQLRVHLYSIGHPIVGDQRYGTKHWPEQAARLLLHAWKLKVRHPAGRWLELESNLPADYEDILDSMRHKSQPLRTS